jgi:hypothetical protein
MDWYFRFSFRRKWSFVSIPLLQTKIFLIVMCSNFLVIFVFIQKEPNNWIDYSNVAFVQVRKRCW